jgi:hypothetical protein
VEVEAGPQAGVVARRFALPSPAPAAFATQASAPAAPEGPDTMPRPYTACTAATRRIGRVSELCGAFPPAEAAPAPAKAEAKEEEVVTEKKSDEYSEDMQKKMGTTLTYRHEDGERSGPGECCMMHRNKVEVRSCPLPGHRPSAAPARMGRKRKRLFRGPEEAL